MGETYDVMIEASPEKLAQYRALLARKEARERALAEFERDAE